MLDTNGNQIARIGRYGNADQVGGQDRKMALGYRSQVVKRHQQGQTSDIARACFG